MKLLLCLLLFMPWFPSPICAQDQAASPLPPPTFTGVAEVIPRLSLLTEQAGEDASGITALLDTTPFEARLATARKEQEELDRSIEELGEPALWSFDRLLEIKERLSIRRDSLTELLEDLSSGLAKLDGIRRQWSRKKIFWQQGEVYLKESGLQVPRESFRMAEGTIAGILDNATNAAAPLVALQKEVTVLKEKNVDLLRQIHGALSLLRGQTFKRTGRPFFSRSYYSQFGDELWRSVMNGVSTIRGIESGFLRDQGWFAALQILAAVALALFIHRHRQQAAETEEWIFILRHPLATGIFVAVSTLSFLYQGSPALWRLLLWALAAFSASTLLAGLLTNKRKIFTVHLLASLLVLSLALQAISFPAPLYRLYLALISLCGVPLLLLMASSNLRAKGGRPDAFTWALRAGALVLLISFVAQFCGFSNLSSRLIESSVETVLVILFATMALRLGRGGLDYLFCREAPERSRFFRGFGEGLAARLKGPLQVMVGAYTFLHLLTVWGLYDGVEQAWQSIEGMGMTLGGTFVSVRMVLSAVLALYVTFSLSWILRALLSAKVFPYSRLDRGARDSIKKLLHYSLILIGFLLAMTLAGVELEHFLLLAGALGIGIGFGLQNVVNNFVSGLILLFERPIKVGDTVVLDEEWGTIRKIGLRSTIVETWNRAEIIVPNSLLIAEKVTNWTLSTNVARVTLSVGVAYGSDIPLVLAILQEAAREHPDVLNDPPPAPIFTGFGESSLDFELRVWMADVTKRLKVRSDLGQHIDRRFREEGVEIPFPQRDLHLRSVDENIRD